jgi:hypothetical protein
MPSGEPSASWSSPFDSPRTRRLIAEATSALINSTFAEKDPSANKQHIGSALLTTTGPLPAASIRSHPKFSTIGPAPLSSTVLIGDRSGRGWAQFAGSALILCGGLWLLERFDGLSYVIVPMAMWAGWACFGPAGRRRDWRRLDTAGR